MKPLTCPNNCHTQRVKPIEGSHCINDKISQWYEIPRLAFNKLRLARNDKKTSIYIFAYLLIGLLAYLFSPLLAQAFTMSNDSYIVQMGNLNTFSGEKSNGQYTLNDTGGQIGPGLYSGTNYQVKAGFQYVSSIIKFKFTISSQNITFGVIDPTSPVTRTQILTVSNGSAGGYYVYGIEDHPLRVFSSGNDIPNTTCDGGTCNQTTAAAWTSTLTYGFGYRCDNLSGSDCESGFSDSTFYKAFASNEANQSPASVMHGTTAGKNHQSQITYKVNISATQPAGNYFNTISYIATPIY